MTSSLPCVICESKGSAANNQGWLHWPYARLDKPIDFSFHLIRTDVLGWINVDKKDHLLFSPFLFTTHRANHSIRKLGRSDCSPCLFSILGACVPSYYLKYTPSWKPLKAFAETWGSKQACTESILWQDQVHISNCRWVWSLPVDQ